MSFFFSDSLFFLFFFFFLETLRIKALTQGHWKPSAELLETHLSFL